MFFMFVLSMKNMFRLLPVICLFSTLQIVAQQNWCNSISNIEKRMLNDAALAQRFDAYKADMQRIAGEDNNGRALTDIIYVPVVFHVIHNGDAVGVDENIPDSKILAQIDAMNAQFNMLDPDTASVPSVFKPLIAKTYIKFCLAKFDENGQPTTGIIRHQYAAVSWNEDNDIDNTIKPATIWDHNKYLNIWTVNMGGTLQADGVLAYATLPFSATADDDGIVSRHTAIGASSKTIVHEAGHWLGLLHVWGFNDNCNDVGDFISDTPDQADLNFGCPTFPSVSCNNGPNGDMFMNYMDYTNDNCRSMFTIGQNNAMRNTLDNTRASIKNAATQCFYSLDAAVIDLIFPADTVCNLSFNPLVTLKNEGVVTLTSGKFYVQIDGGSTQIIDWQGSLLTLAQTQVSLSLQTVTPGAHSITVTFGNANNSTDNFSANDSKTKAFYAYDGGTAVNVPFSEGFEGTFPATNWQVLNPDNDATWAQSSNGGGYGLTARAAAMNNLNFGTNPGKRKDALVTDLYDFSSVQYPELRFDVAYAPYSAGRADSLNVYYSLNCGSSWTKLWSQKGTELTTVSGFRTTTFIPSFNEWKTVNVPVVYLSGQQKVMFKFENVCGWGNVMYLDNINLRNNQALGMEEIKRVDVKIFPNPASAMVGVRLPAAHGFNQVVLLNNLGQEVYQQNLLDNSIIFSTAHLSAGVYYLQLKGKGTIQSEKLIIAR